MKGPGFGRIRRAWEKTKSALRCTVVLLVLMLIGLLAVPVCLITGFIGAVWDLGDKLLSRLSA